MDRQARTSIDKLVNRLRNAAHFHDVFQGSHLNSLYPMTKPVEPFVY